MPFNTRLLLTVKGMEYVGTRLDIVSQILEVANSSSAGGGDGATKNKLMYEVPLNHAQLNEYVMILTERDLLHYDRQTHTLRITEKGLRFLKTYKQMDDMIKAQI
jgi:predicted transcriptional regulator